LYKSKLIKFLKKLSPKETVLLRNYMASPYFNKNEKLLDYYDYLIDFYPSFDGEGIERKQLFAAFFPDTKYNEQNLRYLLSEMTQLVEGFFIQEQLKKRNHTKVDLLVNAFSAKHLNKQYLQKIEKERSALENEPFRTIHYFKEHYELDVRLSDHKFKERNNTTVDFLELLDRNLDVFYVASKIKNACFVENYKNVLEADYNPSFIEDVISIIEKGGLKIHPLIDMYLTVYKMIIEPSNEEHYTLFFGKLVEYIHVFDLAEKRNFYGHARNYCIRKINTGNIEYTARLFELYRAVLENDIILNNGEIEQWDFHNIALLSIRLKELDFSEEFIATYKDKISLEHRENAFTYVSALLQFTKGKYNKTISLLQNVNFSESYYHLITKSLLMKTYYETDEMIPLFSLIDAFTIYLKRNRKLSQYHKKVHGNLVRYVKKMARIKMGSKISPLKLKEEVSEIRQIADSIWLHEKLDELIEQG